MDAILSELLKQAPALGVLVYLVIRFLSHLTELSVRVDKAEETRTKTLTTLGDTCHDFQKEIHNDMRTTVKEVAACVTKSTEVIAQNSLILQQSKEHTEKLLTHIPPKKTRDTD